MSRRLALVGCGAAKRDGRRPAREKYDSVYFRKKRAWAERLCAGWWVLSARYGLLAPDDPVDDYDATIDDVAVGPWLADVRPALAAALDPGDEVWALVGRSYLDATPDDGDDSVRAALAELATPRYPFARTDGIGEQLAWLDRCLDADAVALPGDVPDDDAQRRLGEF